MWPALLTLLPGLLDKLIPDKGAADEAKLKLLALVQTGEIAALQADTQLSQAQADINKTEAQSPRIFVSGWRPFVGWICAAALGFQYIGAPLLSMATGLPSPAIDSAELTPILLGLLGLGSLRTLEKIKGVA